MRTTQVQRTSLIGHPASGTRPALVRKIIAALTLVAALAWGLRVVILEGFVHPWRGGFSGDFAAIMLPKYWDGSGIVFGPVFVIERWLMDAWPATFTVRWFAIADIFLAIGSFLFCVLAARADRWIAMTALVLWVCYRRLYYSFSVAANPEFLELFFLSAAWFAASRRRQAAEGATIALAALTKLFPWVFVIPLLPRRAARALIAAAVVTLLLAAVVGVGQRMPPRELLIQLVSNHVTNGGGAVTTLLPLAYYPRPSDQFLGVAEALAAVMWNGRERTLRPDEIHTVRMATAVVIGVAVVIAIWVAVRLHRSATVAWPVRVGIVYSVFFSLLPIINGFAHPHTYLFLLPVWVALPAIVLSPPRRAAQAYFAAWFALCYVLTGFPVAFLQVDRLLGTSFRNSWLTNEPALSTLLLLGGLAAYAEWHLSIRSTDVPPIGDRSAASA